MRTLQQAIDDCRDLCRQKWGDDWNKRVFLSVEVDVRFYPTRLANTPSIEFCAYVDAAGIGSVDAPSTDDLVEKFRMKLELDPPSFEDAVGACESMVTQEA